MMYRIKRLLSSALQVFRATSLEWFDLRAIPRMTPEEVAEIQTHFPPEEILHFRSLPLRNDTAGAPQQPRVLRAGSVTDAWRYEKELDW
jgi:hypothetical protein